MISGNPSGSVLAPVANPYNMKERIRQANIDLFKDNLRENAESPRIKFNDYVCLLENDSSEIRAAARGQSNFGSGW